MGYGRENCSRQALTAKIVRAINPGMDTKHPHAAAIDRLGRERIKSHFNITTRAIQKWRADGIPPIHWKTVRLLGAVHGVSVAELGENA